MTVIAMTWELGSFGDVVADALAEDLHLDRFACKLLENIDDSASTENYHQRSYKTHIDVPQLSWGRRELDYAINCIHEILNAASGGDVLIHGWGAAYVLRHVSHVLCVRVCAPFELRVKTVMSQSAGSNEETVRKHVFANDVAHAQTMQNLFQVDWKNERLYDIVLNTGCEPSSDCVEILKKMLQSAACRETPSSLRLLSEMRKDARLRASLAKQGVARLDEYLNELPEKIKTGR